MDKKEIALELTLKLLDNFAYPANEYGGNTLSEHAAFASELAAMIFNDIYKNLVIE